MDDEVFEEHRSLLIGVAYRMLGSMWDAEDVVQEAYLRWRGTDTAEVRDPRAFLVTVTSRIALDQLRSARHRRESYVGPWLPEPVESADLGPLDSAELHDTVSLATLHLMERLTPPERAVFVLRSAFELPYERIATVVDASAATCRQLFLRATRHLGRERATAPDAEEHRRLLRRFLDAAVSGDLDELTSLLAADVTAWGDGGGKVKAALRPIVGRDKVVAFFVATLRRFPVDEARIVEVNGLPAMLTVSGSDRQIVALGLGPDGVERILAVRNPDKLTRVG